MKKRGKWIEPEGAVELPESKRHGSYPPDIARRRRALRLPVTPAEHAAYDRGEFDEPVATAEQMAKTLREVLPRCSPLFAHTLRDIAARIRGRQREPGED
jgi:hypothetical protein